MKGGEVQGPGDPKQLEELGDQLRTSLGSLHQGSERHQRDFPGKKLDRFII